MIKQLAIIGFIAAQAVSVCQAQQAVASNPHKAQAEKLRECRKAATDLGLQGDPRRTFIAECLSRPTQR